MAILYVLPSLAVLGIWYVLLFVATGTTTPEHTFRFVLTEDPRRLWFYWLLAVPFLWMALSAAYLTPIASRRVGAATLLALGTLLAIGAWLTLSFEVALVASLPLVYGAKSVRDAYQVR